MRRSILPAFALALGLAAGVACTSGGNGNGGGIGGSGIVAQGTITGFGSIFVNGIRFDTDAAMISIDGNAAATASDLRLGMIVTVVGRLDAGGQTGSADAVVYDDSLEGPVNMVTTDVDGDSQTLDVLGDTVVADRAATVYDGPTGFNFASIATLDVVRVSGFRDGDDRLVATRIEKIGEFDPMNPGATEIEVSGLVSGLMGMSFTIRTLTVNMDGNTEVPDGPVMDGQLVEVEGVMQSATSVLANEVELEDDGLPDDAGEVEIEGVVNTFVSLSDFRVAGVAVNAGTAQFEPPSLMTSIDDGSRVEVEGALQGGVLIAESVKGRGGSVRVEAYVIATDPVAGTVQLGVAPNVTVTLMVEAETEFKSDDDPVDLASINTGDYLSVRGFMGASGLVASSVRRTESDDRVVIQGQVEASSPPPGGTITVLGRQFVTDGATQFQRDGEDDDADITDAEFFSDPEVTDLTAVVKLVDDIDGAMLGDGVLERVDIERDNWGGNRGGDSERGD